MPADDLKGLVAWLKANPDKALQGATGQGSTGHIAGVFFQKATGTRYQFVFYRGNPQQVQDLLSGQIDLMFDLAASALPHIRAGSIKVYAVADKTRLAVAPEIPTVDEAGLPDFYLPPWHALFVPKGTPKTISKTLNAAVVDALADPNVRQRLADLGQEIFRAISSLRMHWPSIKEPRSRDGGRSSRRQASRSSSSWYLTVRYAVGPVALPFSTPQAATTAIVVGLHVWP